MELKGFKVTKLYRQLLAWSDSKCTNNRGREVWQYYNQKRWCKTLRNHIKTQLWLRKRSKHYFPLEKAQLWLWKRSEHNFPFQKTPLCTTSTSMLDTITSTYYLTNNLSLGLDRFVHNWLFHKNLNTSMKSGLAYYEGKVMFSSLCKQRKIFNSTPCKQFTTWFSNTKILLSLK